MIDLVHLEEYKENNRIEAKRALGGLPKSIWETYSAFANTLGGIILMGVEEAPDKSLHAVDLPHPEALIDEFLSGMNDPRKVSINILREDDIRIETVDGCHIIVINVPRAPRLFKPVYIEGDHIFGSYRRNGEGDYRCTAEELLAMYRDARAAEKEMREADPAASGAAPDEQKNRLSESEIRKSVIISYITDHVLVSEQELADLLGIDMVLVQTLMGELLEDGFVTAEGGGKNRRYRLKA